MMCPFAQGKPIRSRQVTDVTWRVDPTSSHKLSILNMLDISQECNLSDTDKKFRAKSTFEF